MSDTKFKKGQSGNPAGRPKGSKDRRSEYRELFKSAAPELVEKAIQLALGGDVVALRMCIDRIAPVARENPVSPVLLPSLDSAESVCMAHNQITQKLASGELLPSEASVLSSLLDKSMKLVELLNLEKRIEKMEADFESQRKAR